MVPVVVVVVGGRKGFPQEVLGSHVTATSDLERLMSEDYGTLVSDSIVDGHAFSSVP